MKLWKLEIRQNFCNLTKFTKSFRCSHCWIIEIDQCKFTIFKKKIEFNFKIFLIFYNYAIFASQHMIKIKINQIMKLIKRFSTLQKWIKSKTYCKKYCALKFFTHQIQRNKMFFVFVFRFRRIQIHYHAHQHITQYVIDDFLKLLNSYENLLLNYKLRFYWNISNVECKNY